MRTVSMVASGFKITKLPNNLYMIVKLSDRSENLVVTEVQLKLLAKLLQKHI